MKELMKGEVLDGFVEAQRVKPLTEFMSTKMAEVEELGKTMLKASDVGDWDTYNKAKARREQLIREMQEAKLPTVRNAIHKLFWLPSPRGLPALWSEITIEGTPAVRGYMELRVSPKEAIIKEIYEFEKRQIIEANYPWTPLNVEYSTSIEKIIETIPSELIKAPLAPVFESASKAEAVVRVEEIPTFTPAFLSKIEEAWRSKSVQFYWEWIMEPTAEGVTVTLQGTKKPHEFFPKDIIERMKYDPVREHYYVPRTEALGT